MDGKVSEGVQTHGHLHVGQFIFDFLLQTPPELVLLHCLVSLHGHNEMMEMGHRVSNSYPATARISLEQPWLNVHKVGH